MDKILLKEIVKLVLIIVGPLAILSILFFDVQPKLALAFLLGMLLGIIRLKTFFGFIISVLDHEKLKKDIISLLKYIASWLFTLGAIGFVLVESTTIGLAVLLGLTAVPILVTIYTMLKGISLFRAM